LSEAAEMDFLQFKEQAAFKYKNKIAAAQS
jgi:hypothetical protein